MKGIVEVTLNNGSSKIGADEFGGYRIFNSLKEGLPFGYFKIIDRTGNTFAQYENLQTGASVAIEIINLDNNQIAVQYPIFYILFIENDCSLQPSKLAGGVKVWFGHPWFLFKDVKNHAYKPMNNGKLIKKVIESEDRGMPFEVEDKNFDTTDDKGKLARYKTCESDWEFIQNKVLPYTMIKENPAHFFINEMGHIMLKSFGNLYKENPKMIFHQVEEVAGTQEESKDIYKLIEKYGMNKEWGHLAIKDANVVVGNTEMLKELYPSFYLENNVAGTFVKGQKKMANKLSSSWNLLPIDNQLMGKLSGTSTKVMHNRQLEDAMTLVFQTGKYIDFVFMITVTTLFCGHTLTVGDTAELFFNKALDDTEAQVNEETGALEGTKDKAHWASGKWLIAKMESYTDKDDPKQLMTSTTLVRPAIKNDGTSLSMAPTMYEAQ